MSCPHCGEQNQDETGACFHCGQPLQQVTSVRRGSVVASRYEILEPLGRGGMGMVYRAHDRTLDEEVALKVLRSEVARDADMARRFRQEIKLARKVRHANVCGIHEYGEDGDLRFIAMEFIRGVDLRQVLERRGALPAGEAFAVAIQIADGLDAIHEAGIIHRDLKTPNIMVDDRGRIRLMDFGIAKLANREATLGATAFGVVVGTPEYMSPEQARGEKVDFRSDVYALGIVIFELFTGKVPFRGETPIATIFKHIQEEPPLRAAALPPALVPILEKALAKKSADRQADVRVVSEELKAARATVPEGRLLPPVIRSATLELPLVDASLETQPTPVPSRVPTEVRAVVPDEAEEQARLEAERAAVETRRSDEAAAARAAEEAQRKEAARQAAEARRREEQATARAAEEARKAEAAARKAEAARQAEEARRLEAERKAERARQAEAQKQAARAQAQEERRRADERKRAEADARARARAAAGEAAPRSRGPMVAAIAAGCVAAVALVVWLAWPRPVPPTDPTATTLAAVDPAEPQPTAVAPVAGAGTLVVDAVPWGEVVEVKDADGRPQALAGSRSTPFLVALPAGAYTVSVRGPDGRETKAVAVSLGASVTQSRTVEFRRVDARAYFRRAGFADAR
jgi:predicted Ser/Thr protein kinase